jgi:hypothetical protein
MDVTPRWLCEIRRRKAELEEDASHSVQLPAQMARTKVCARMSTQIGATQAEKDRERDQAAARQCEQAARLLYPPALVEKPGADDQLDTSLRAYAHSGRRDDEAKEKLLDGTPHRIKTCDDHREVVEVYSDQDEGAEEAIAPRVAMVEESEEASGMPVCNAPRAAEMKCQPAAPYDEMAATIVRCEEFRRAMAQQCVAMKEQAMAEISTQAVTAMEFKYQSSAALNKVERLSLTAQGEVHAAGLQALNAVADCEQEFMDKLKAAQARAIEDMQDAAAAARDSAIYAIENAAACARDAAIARVNEGAKAHLKIIERARRSVVVVRLEPELEDSQRSHRRRSQQNSREPVRRRRSRSPERRCSASKSRRRCQ